MSKGGHNVTHAVDIDMLGQYVTHHAGLYPTIPNKHPTIKAPMIHRAGGMD